MRCTVRWVLRSACTIRMDELAAGTGPLYTFSAAAVAPHERAAERRRERGADEQHREHRTELAGLLGRLLIVESRDHDLLHDRPEAAEPRDERGRERRRVATADVDRPR